MNKLSLLAIILCLTIAFTQQDAPSQDQISQQLASMRRTACLVLSRHHSNTQKDVIEGVVQGLSPELQQAYINKIYATGVETCEPLISQSEVQQMFVQSNEPFDPAHLFHFFETVDYEALSNSIDKPLTANQKTIVQFIKKFDQQMAVRKEQQQAESNEKGNAEGNDIKILGLSFSKMSGFSKFVYVAIFASIVGAALFYGFQKLDDKKQKKSNKRRKSPKKD